MKPKKSLGQNFLRDEEVLQKIISVSDLKSDDFVIEIGPGEGVLSSELIKKVGKLIMIEKDERLAEKLAKNFQFSILNFQSISNNSILNFKNKGIIIIGDILEINLPKILKENNFQKYKLIANIPYYITSPIIQLFLETTLPPTEMILMVQREVAQRICATPGQMSILAVSVQYRAKAEILFEVDRKSFYPVPEVDSAVIKISNIQKKNKENSKKFFRVVKAGFSSKRKTLLNNLSSSLHLEKEVIEKTLQKINIKPNQRAQELSINDWEKLTNLI